MSRICIRGTWIPILAGVPAGAARASVADIIATLLAEPGASASLGDGAAGIALFLACAEKAGFDLGGGDPALAYLDRAIAALAEEPMGPQLFSGFPGIAWAMQHIALLRGGDGDERCAEIDRLLLPYLERAPWEAEFDLISGLVGLGVYCLERGASPSARRSLAAIVDRLWELADHSEDEARWFTHPHLLTTWHETLYPEGYYDLGVAHGISGIIGLLGRIAAASEKTRALMERAVCWLLRQRLPEEAGSCFSTLLPPNHKPEPSPLAWCRGDPGVAAALFSAGAAAGSKECTAAGLAIARAAARRAPEASGVVDVSFCHGSAGLAHIFNRFHQATREPIFARAAHAWYLRTLASRRPGMGGAGYQVVVGSDERGRPVLGTKLGLLTGIAGLGLSLLAGISDIEPAWDRIFLVDLA